MIMWKSVYKYPTRNVMYLAILSAAFTATLFLVGTDNVARNVINYLVGLLEARVLDPAGYSSLASPLITTASSLTPTIAITILLSVSTLPFVCYLFCIGRGYELGVFRVLGLNRAGVWLRLIIENIVFMLAAIIISLGIAAAFFRGYAYGMLSLYDIEATLYNLTGNYYGIADNVGIGYRPIMATLILAGVITVISTALQGIVIVKNEPMKLIRNFK